MSCWDVDGDSGDEESGVSKAPRRIGHEYYSIVVHYAGTLPVHCIPNHIKLDAKGNPVKSLYKQNDFQTEEGTRESVTNQRVVKWSTKKEHLDTLTSESKAACNALKTFLNKNKCMLWYHNGNEDDCATFSKKHWHIVLQSELNTAGECRYLHDLNQFRQMKTKISATTKGYVRTLGIKSPVHIVRHFNCPPRVYMGCNFPTLYRLYKEAVQMGTLVGKINDYVDEPSAEEEDEDNNTTKFDSWDMGATNAIVRKRKAEWDVDDVSFCTPAASKLPVVIKETATDAIGKVLRVLMKRYRANNPSEMFAAISKLAPGQDTEYKAVWSRLSSKTTIGRMMEASLNYLKCEKQNKTFEQMIDEFCQSPDILSDEEYESPEDSYTYFLSWCKFQHIDPLEIITNTMDVMNKKQLKKNSICLIGDTNAGKTVMFADPIKYIMRFVGQIGNRTENNFMWQDCVNCCLICIDECIMDPAHLEDLKMVLGGEKVSVSVKFQGNSSLNRTPVILTGNKVPWAFDQTAKAALLSRMFYYPVQTNDELQYVKKIHPGMWWYLQQQYGKEQLIPKSRLVPYPEVRSDDNLNEETVNEDDIID